MAGATEGWAGARHLLARLVPKRANVPWYSAVLLGFPAASFVAAWLLDPNSLGVGVLRGSLMEDHWILRHKNVT